MDVFASLWYVVLESFRLVPRCGRAGLCDNSPLSFLRRIPAEFHSGCSNLQNQGSLLLTSLPAFGGSFLAAILTLNFHF